MSVNLEAIFYDLQLESFCGIIQENGRSQEEAEGLLGHPSKIIPSVPFANQTWQGLVCWENHLSILNWGILTLQCIAMFDLGNIFFFARDNWGVATASHL